MQNVTAPNTVGHLKGNKQHVMFSFRGAHNKNCYFEFRAVFSSLTVTFM